MTHSPPPSSSLPSPTELDTAVVKAAKAIAYLLDRSRRDDKLYYQIGFGTEAFRLLTDAHAALIGEDVAAVEKRYGA